MPTAYDSAKAATPAKRVPLRILSSIVRQKAETQICPDAQDHDNKIAIVTGGARGIGAAITSGLLARGAEVIALSRGMSGAAEFCSDLVKRHGKPTTFIPMDLADATSIAEATEKVGAVLNGRQVNTLCMNAGVSPKRGAKTSEGFEQAFAVNCLGHHRLLQGLDQQGLVAPNARVVGTTGDIYCLASECTADFESNRSAFGGPLAYARSKLGNIWQFREFAVRSPNRSVVLVHPGVAATELEGSLTGLTGATKRWLMISPEQAAQASLIGASQPLISGTYFHNMHGEMDLHPDDPANDVAKQAAFYDLLEELS